MRGLDSAEYTALQPDNSAFQCVLALYPTGKCSTPLNMLHAGNHSASPRIILHVAALAPDAISTDHAERLIQVLLTELSRMPVTGVRLPVSSDARLQSVAESIIGASTVRKGLSDWARYIGMSRRSLARLVVKETGLSFGRWRQQLLLVIAIQKLSDGVSVQQTAWDLGYESVTAFITMFKKALGTSPGKYAMEDAAGK